MKVAMVLGSPAPLPPVRGIAPALVVYYTAEHLHLPGLRVFSHWEPALDEIDYDHQKYQAVRIDPAISRWVRWIKKLPYRVHYALLKHIFLTNNTESVEYYWSLAAEVRKYRPEVILLHVSYGVVYPLRWACPRARLVYYHHGSNMHMHFTEAQWRRFVRALDGIVSVSGAAFREIESRYGRIPLPTWVIRNGIDARRFHPALRDQYRAASRQRYGIPQEAFVFLYAGRIVESKGIHCLVQAVGELLAACPQICLIVAGSSAQEHRPENDYERQVMQMAEGLGPAVKFVGWLPNEQMPELIAAADACVLPAMGLEGIPLSLLESMACGVPVIATGLGGIPEIVEHESTGLLVSLERIQEELPAAMRRLVIDQALWRACSQNAAAYALREHTYEIVAEKVNQVIEAIGGEHR